MSATAFLPNKVKQDGVDKAPSGTPKKKAKPRKPKVSRRAKPEPEIAFRQNMIFTTADEIELDRIEDYLRGKGIRRLDRSKLLRMALRAAFKEMKEVDVAALLTEVVATDKRHRRSIARS